MSREPGKGVPTNVDVDSAPVARYRPLLDEEAWSGFERTLADLARTLHGRTLWNINSTARGGGVAELLAALIPYDRGAGIDERWVALEGSPEFFKLTKKIHKLLHGASSDGSEITDSERDLYERELARNATTLADIIRPHDVVIVHDPQPAGLIPSLTARGCHVIWRSHVGVDRPNELVRKAWAFLMPYLAGSSAYVFSRRTYVWEGLDPECVQIIAPCIDPFTAKNQEMTDKTVSAILHASGFTQGPEKDASFTRSDGTTGRVVRRALLRRPLPAKARFVLQVSRWDRLKDPVGVMEGFANHVAPLTDAWLILAGPATASIRDDPEQPKVLDEVERRRARIDPAVRERILIAQLPMEDLEENAAIVNALQRRADVVVQKSLAEGFGLTVAEAMWKARPVVASRVGGIEDQIEDGKSGVLISNPKDLRAFGEAIVRLLQKSSEAKRLGVEARSRISREFLAPCYLVQQGRLIMSLGKVKS